MRIILAVSMLAVACGGSEPRRSFEGTWNVHISGASGQMTLAAEGADGIGGTWNVAGLGMGAVAGAVTFGDSIYFAFVDGSHEIGADVTATVSRDAMSGVTHGPPQATFTATRR